MIQQTAYTIGTEMIIMTMHVKARQPVKSEITPAKMPPSDMHKTQELLTAALRSL